MHQGSSPYLPDFQTILEDRIHSIRFLLRPLQDVRVILGLLLAQGGVWSVIVKLWAVSFCCRKKKKRRKVKSGMEGEYKLQRYLARVKELCSPNLPSAFGMRDSFNIPAVVALTC